MSGHGAHVALLRGINVGGKNRLPMNDLATMFKDAGAADVRTYIQSGNVIFRADAARALRLGAAVGKAMQAELGWSVPIVVRSAAALGATAKGNPFLAEKVPLQSLHVGFLLARPDRTRVAALDPDRSPPDRFVVRGDTLYLHLPNGVARTKLTSQYLDSRLGTVVTVRNWNTVTTLLEMTREKT
ncbi:MAG TPA: DUF1697 domain-containing protein [Candidatus Polarisedimenticolia bacterium]|nr:DUF1697 domain-containing protein [Candidatus Polarisedimenticolia bacterium]